MLETRRHRGGGGPHRMPHPASRLRHPRCVILAHLVTKTVTTHLQHFVQQLILTNGGLLLLLLQYGRRRQQSAVRPAVQPRRMHVRQSHAAVHGQLLLSVEAAIPRRQETLLLWLLQLLLLRHGRQWRQQGGPGRVWRQAVLLLLLLFCRHCSVVLLPLCRVGCRCRNPVAAVCRCRCGRALTAARGFGAGGGGGGSYTASIAGSGLRRRCRWCGSHDLGKEQVHERLVWVVRRQFVIWVVLMMLWPSQWLCLERFWLALRLQTLNSGVLHTRTRTSTW